MSTTARFVFFCLIGQIGLSLFFSQSVLSEAPAKIIAITPSGDVDSNQKVSQIVFQYDQPVVPLGKMSRDANEIPIEISPSVECQWRWLDRSTLACELSTLKPLSAGTTYRISVTPSAMADAAAFTEAREHSFTIKRPEVTYAFLDRYLSPERPRYFVQSNIALERSALKKHLFFQEGSGDRIEATVEELEHSPYDNDGYVDSSFEKGTWWAVSPSDDLAPGVPFTLESEPGIVARSGNAESTAAKELISGEGFGDFTFVGVRCYSSRSRDKDDPQFTIFAQPDAGAAPEDRVCDPMQPVSVVFSSPVTTKDLKKALVLTPNPYGESALQGWEQMPEFDHIYETHQTGNTYEVQIPGPLKAETRFAIALKRDQFRDFFDRALPSDVDFYIPLGARRARIISPERYSTLESQVDTAPAIYLTNINELKFDYQKFTAASGRESGVLDLSPYSVRNLSYKFPLPIKDMLHGGSGLVVGSLRSEKKRAPSEKTFFVQRTPFSVHVKISHFNSVIWVTDSQTGEAVSGATVEILQGKLSNLLADAVSRTKGTTDRAGVAVVGGTNVVDPTLDYLFNWDQKAPFLVVRVTRDDDIAVVPLNYDFRADTKYYSTIPAAYGTIRAWGTTAQGIYRAGDTMQYKIVVRDVDKDSFITPQREKYNLEILDPLDKKVFERKNISLSEYGTFDGSFAIPKSATVGWYTFKLRASFVDRSWEAMRVLVSDFTPAPFRVSVDLNKPAFESGSSIEVKTRAAFHAGGAYGGAKGQLSVSALPKLPEFDKAGLDDFVFSDELIGDEKEVFRREYTLSSGGEDLATVALSDDTMIFGTLRIESAVADERGKNIAGYATIPYYGRERYVGLQVDSWVFEKDKESIVRLAVVDGRGDAKPGTKVHLRFERDEVRAVQVKGAGNAFLPNYQTETILVKEDQVESDVRPIELRFSPHDLGTFRIVAEIQDANGKAHSTRIERWVVGSGETIWQSDADEQVRVTSERNSYAIGETASFLIQNPFPGAQALISIEREGVITQWVETLKDAAAIVKVPIESRYAPGFYFSAVLMSPRAAAAPIDKGVDLGKPAFRTGYAQISVPKSGKRLTIEAHAKKALYQPGDEVELSLSARDANGKPVKGELTVTVLDQAVFDLIKDAKSLYDVYNGFYQLGTLGVTNFNLLRQIIGRQNFERKGMTQAGDGGRGNDLRSIDSFVAFWGAAIKLNAAGEAKVTFRAPGNLTGWKVLALALNRGDRMGSGEAEFAVSKDIEIRPVNPQIVRLGDSFSARFSLMNRTQSAQTAEILINARGGANGEKKYEQIALAPSERRVFALELKPNALEPIALEVSARAGDAHDGLKLAIPVLPTLGSERVMQTVAIEKAEEQLTLKVPGDLKPGEGKLLVSLFPSLVGDLSPAFDYLRHYPFYCWEQRMSKAIGAAWFLKGGNNLPQSFQWANAQTIVNELFKSAPDFQGENGGMAYFRPEPASIDPYLSAYTGLVFEWLKDAGYQPPTAVSERLYKYLQDFLRNDPPGLNFYGPQDLFATRLIALRVLAGAGMVEKEDAIRFTKELEKQDVFSLAMLLETYQLLKMEKEAAAIKPVIQTKGDINSDAVSFTHYYQYGFRYLSSDVRSGCELLSALSAPNSRRDISSDWMTKVVRGIVKQKGSGGYWSNTQENIFCINALRRYAASESSFDSPLEISAAVEGDAFAKARFTSPVDAVTFFERPILPIELGIDRQLHFRKSGSRRGYATVGLEYPQRQIGEKNVGIEVYREYSVKSGREWKVINGPLHLKLGDVVRVDLYLIAPAARTFVALEDKLPGAFEVINKNLATSSLADATVTEDSFPSGSRFADHRQGFEGMGYGIWGFSHFEQKNDSVRFYSEYLQPGQYHLTHFVQVVASGDFTAPAAHAEEMYAPAVYGESLLTDVHTRSE